jgi:hypothetical protein
VPTKFDYSKTKKDLSSTTKIGNEKPNLNEKEKYTPEAKISSYKEESAV